MDRKGQAAMEFLMTYGWAILAALVAIGVLGWYLSTSTSSTPKAQLDYPFYAVAWSASGTNNNITLEVRNQLSEAVDIHAVDAAEICNPGTLVASVNIAAGNNGIVGIDCSTGGLTAGDSLRGAMTVTYQKASASLNETTSGSIVGTVGA